MIDFNLFVLDSVTAASSSMLSADAKEFVPSVVQELSYYGSDVRLYHSVIRIVSECCFQIVMLYLRISCMSLLIIFCDSSLLLALLVSQSVINFVNCNRLM